jgi:cell division protein FtsW
VRTQAMALCLGVMVGVAVYLVPLATWRRYRFWLLGVSVVLLIGLFFFGVKVNGATSWYQIWRFRFQPSEPSKLALLVYLAAAFSSKEAFSKGAGRKWVMPLVTALFVFALIVAQRDLGTALLYAAIYWFVFFAAGAKKWLMGLIAVGAVLLYFVGIHVIHNTPQIQDNHIAERVEAHFQPHEHRYDTGLQATHSLIGLSRGGLIGLGMCEGREKHYIPAASTDYIFVTIGEELGLAGGVVLLFLFAVFTWRGLEIARKCPSRFGGILAAGITAAITLQVWINIAVVTNLTIATGLPLPFISYGGSSILTLCMAVGLLLSISKYTNGSQVEGADDYESHPNRRGNGRTRVSGTGNRSRPTSGGRGSRGSIRW